MSELNQTPAASRVHIAFFGLRNAGKSTLVNAFTGQELAIVSATAGTTTDPVSKAMEIAPLGPCLITDTAGLDDEGTLGELRVKRSLDVLQTTDIAVWVETPGEDGRWRERVEAICRRQGIAFVVYHRGDEVAALGAKVAAIKVESDGPGLLDGLVRPGDEVVCVTPIDAAAPRARLILPQVQVIRACLDIHALCTVMQVEEFERFAAAGRTCALVITDSQAFAKVSAAMGRASAMAKVPLTSFSVLFARQKGDLVEFSDGLRALKRLKEGDTVIISEACTHRGQCDDIGSRRIPAAVTRLSGVQHLNFVFSSGSTFNADTMRSLATHAALIVHCGACMLTRRALQARIALAKAAKVPIVNYGLVLAAAAGLGEVRSSGVID